MIENQPSMKQIKYELLGLGFISLFSPKMRKLYKNMKTDFSELLEIATKYNEYFSDYGWCIYGKLKPEMVKDAIRTHEEKSFVDAEALIIDYYLNDVKLQAEWLKNQSEEFRIRADLIKKAFADHFAHNFHASVPLFLMLADGIVQDFTKKTGLWSDKTDLDVWDSLVGADDGFKKIIKIMKTSRKKTTTDKIEFPYRNGILHGRDLSYDNEKVSCKCVCMIFALADWINAKKSESERKAEYERMQNPPPLKEILKNVLENKKKRDELQKERDSWVSRSILINETVPEYGNSEEYTGYGYLEKIAEMMLYWKKSNYGYLSKCFNKAYFYGSENVIKECKEFFSEFKPTAWKLINVEEKAPCFSIVVIEITYNIDGKIIIINETANLVYENDDMMKEISVPWRNNGEWKIAKFNSPTISINKYLYNKSRSEKLKNK